MTDGAEMTVGLEEAVNAFPSRDNVDGHVDVTFALGTVNCVKGCAKPETTRAGIAESTILPDTNGVPDVTATSPELRDRTRGTERWTIDEEIGAHAEVTALQTEGDGAITGLAVSEEPVTFVSLSGALSKDVDVGTTFTSRDNNDIRGDPDSCLTSPLLEVKGVHGIAGESTKLRGEKGCAAYIAVRHAEDEGCITGKAVGKDGGLAIRDDETTTAAAVRPAVRAVTEPRILRMG